MSRIRISLLTLLILGITGCDMQGGGQNNPQFTDLNTNPGLGASIAFDSTGKELVVGSLASDSQTGSVRIWDISNPATATSTLLGLGSSYSVAFSPDNNIVAAGEGDYSVK